MAKNELLPFANGEDANVLPTQQWEALTDILENGFQSGVARSEQVNRVLAQGAVASYVLGQLIVDQLAQDATLDETTLYQNLVSALQENAKDVCLPLGGGVLAGSVGFSDALVSGYLNFLGTSGYFAISGAPWDQGARIAIYGENNANNPGEFVIGAIANNQSCWLRGKPDKTLTWNNRELTSGIPDYDSGITFPNATNYTVPKNGIIAVKVSGNNASGNAYLYQAETTDEILWVHLTSQYNTAYTTFAIVEGGKTYYFNNGNTTNITAKYFPFL